MDKKIIFCIEHSKVFMNIEKFQLLTKYIILSEFS